MNYGIIADKLSENEKLLLHNLDTEINGGNIYAKEAWATFFAFDRPDLISDTVKEKILSYYEEAVAAGISRGALNLGAVYYNGVLTERNYSKAFELYTLASNSDDEHIAAAAICNIGYCHYCGRSVPVNKAKAFGYFLKGALKYSDANCLYKLGDFYMSGDVVDKDEIMGFEMYERAAACCNRTTECRDAVYMRCGKCLLKGIGTEADPEEAVIYLVRAKAAACVKILARNHESAPDLITELDIMIAEAENKLLELDHDD